MHCASMDDFQKCIKCTCDYSEHLHMYYMTKIEQGYINTTMWNKNSDEEVMINLEKTINNIEDKIKELESERIDIVTKCAMFTYFLESNFVNTCNDSYKFYMDYLIKR